MKKRSEDTEIKLLLFIVVNVVIAMFLMPMKDGFIDIHNPWRFPAYFFLVLAALAGVRASINSLKGELKPPEPLPTRLAKK